MHRSQAAKAKRENQKQRNALAGMTTSNPADFVPKLIPQKQQMEQPADGVQHPRR